jgi:hypothetical protein
MRQSSKKVPDVVIKDIYQTVRWKIEFNIFHARSIGYWSLVLYKMQLLNSVK